MATVVEASQPWQITLLVIKMNNSMGTTAYLIIRIDNWQWLAYRQRPEVKLDPAYQMLYPWYSPILQDNTGRLTQSMLLVPARIRGVDLINESNVALCVLPKLVLGVHQKKAPLRSFSLPELEYGQSLFAHLTPWEPSIGDTRLTKPLLHMQQDAKP